MLRLLFSPQRTVPLLCHQNKENDNAYGNHNKGIEPDAALKPNKPLPNQVNTANAENAPRYRQCHALFRRSQTTDLVFAIAQSTYRLEQDWPVHHVAVTPNSAQTKRMPQYPGIVVNKHPVILSQ